MPKLHIVDTQRDKRNNCPVLDSFWKIAEHYGVSFQELKQINTGKGTEKGGYPYEKRNPPYWLNDGDIVILPKKQPSDKELGNFVVRCPLGNLIVHVRRETTIGPAISGATIRIIGPETRFGTTDDAGKEEFKKIRPGNYTVEASKDLLTPNPAIVSVEVSSGSVKEATLILNCIIHKLSKSFLIAKATSSYLRSIKLTEKLKVNGDVLDLGQDITYSSNRKAPGNRFVGVDVKTLKDKMYELLDEFAEEDKSGMAKRLFDRFLKKNKSVEVFMDAALNKAIEKHPNFISFSELTLAAPGTKGANPKKTRIHHALNKANWDINKVALIDDLGTPAFNLGAKQFWGKARGIKDFGNGLALMINDVSYVFVYVEKYNYNSCKQQYHITLKFILYDVFGLDDNDLIEFGASTPLDLFDAPQGITAWWQLQHQFNYAPLLTKAVVYRDFAVSTSSK